MKNNFGDDVGRMTIGERRDEIIQITPGPGTYSPEKSNHLTLASSPAFDFSKQPERPDMKVQNLNGPGSYDTHHNFG